MVQRWYDLSVKDQNFEQIIKQQIENERFAANLLHESARKTKNVVIQLLLYQLALDSAKHEQMLEAILELLKKPSEGGLVSEGEGFRKIIEKHVEIERKMLEDFEKIVDKAEDKRIRFIIQEIINDEKRHHAVIKRVYELVCESEKVKDEKWWDFLFRYSKLTG